MGMTRAIKRLGLAQAAQIQTACIHHAVPITTALVATSSAVAVTHRLCGAAMHVTPRKS